jgi:cell division protein FtsB
MSISRKTQKEISWILFLLSCLPICYLLVFGDGGYLRLRHYEEELQRLQLENAKLQEHLRSLLSRIEKVKNDPEEVERIARERYNLARPGDIIVYLPE